MGMGQDAHFLQDVLVVRMFDDQVKESGEDGDHDEAAAAAAAVAMDSSRGGIGGEALGLGQVRGKFVVTPNWEEIL